MALSSLPRSRRTLTILDLLPEKRYACDECEGEIAIDQPRYHCSRCRDYDTCTHCHATTAHAHDDGERQPVWTEVLLWPEPTTAPLEDGSPFAATIDDAMLRFSERPCLGLRTRADDPSSISWLTYRAMRQRAHACSVGLLRRMDAARALHVTVGPSIRFCHCSIAPRPCVAIWAANCIDWVVADLACHLQHCVVVPIDYNTANSEAVSIMQQMQVSAVFVDPSILSRFTPLAPSLPALHTVVVLNAADLVMAIPIPGNPHLAVVSIEEVERAGASASLDESTATIYEARPDCVVSVMYTSGSTGEAGSAAKGVLITDAGFSYRSGSPMRGHDVRVACYLPLSNSTSRSQAMRCLAVGGAVGIVQSPDCFLADLAWIQPTTLSCPPRLWNMLHATYNDDLNHALTHTPALGRTREAAREQADSVAMGRFRARLGGRVQAVSTGGAKSSADLLKFLQRCFGATSADSYGATECGSIARGGYVLPGVEVMLLDVPSLGFTASDLPWPRGELCVASRNMAAGYTSDALSHAFIQMNGRVYYRTGDVVELRRGSKLRGEGDQLRVLDRVSNVVKLSNGLFVSPETIEHAMEMHCPHIEHLLLHAPVGGDSLSAVVVPRASAPRWSDAEWLQQLERVADDNKLPNYCKPALIYVDRSGVSWEGLGLLAAQHKKRRTAVLLRYKSELQQLTNQSPEGQLTTDDVEMTQSLSQPTSMSLRQRLQAALLSHLPATTKSLDACADKSWLEAGGDSMAAIAAAHSVGLIRPDQPVSATQILSASSLHSLLFTLLADDNQVVTHPSIASSPLDWSLECSLSIDMQRLRQPMSAVMAVNQSTSPTVLLTGATGFLGSFVLAHLLNSHPNCSVVCIVRAPSTEAAMFRLTRSLSQYSIASSESVALSMMSSHRVRVEIGDVAAEKFGLPSHHYAELADNITHVIHNASRVNFVLPYAALRRDNVQSTIEILRFCCAGRQPKALCYVSTASTEQCTLNNVGQLSGHGGYAQSKWVSEQLVRRAVRELSVSACIVRPTSIIGDSKGGAGPADPSKDLVSALWLGIARVGQVHLLSARPITKTLDRVLTLRDVLPLLASHNRTSAAGGVDDQHFRLVGLPLAFCLVPVDYVARVVAQSTFSLSCSTPPAVSATVVRVDNPRGNTSPLSLFLATDPSFDTPVVVGEEAKEAWRQLVHSDALPPVMRAFRDYLLQPATVWSNSDSAPRSTSTSRSAECANDVESGSVRCGEGECPVVDLPLLRRCFHRLNSTSDR